MNKRKILFALLLIPTFILVAYAVPLAEVPLSSTLLIADPDLTVTDSNGNIVSSVEWGTVDKGSVTPMSFVLRNEGNVPLTVTMTDTLDPSVGSLDWNLQGVSIASHASSELIFTLTIPQTSSSGPFSFTIMIHGEG